LTGLFFPGPTAPVPIAPFAVPFDVTSGLAVLTALVVASAAAVVLATLAEHGWRWCTVQGGDARDVPASSAA